MNEPVQERLYRPTSDEPQLTLRAVLAGCGLGALLALMNLYAGLAVGLTAGGSVMIAVLALSIFSTRRTRKRYTPLEATQTLGSASGTMASATGLLAPIPAMALLGVGLSTVELVLWSLTITYFGVFLATGLRRHFILVEKLPFPDGTATANTIVSMTQDPGEAAAQTRALLWVGIGTVLLGVATHFVPELEFPPLPLIWGGFATVAAWSFIVHLNPLLFGVGMLIGPGVSMTFLAGSIIAWGGIGPLAVTQGWVEQGNVVDLWVIAIAPGGECRYTNRRVMGGSRTADTPAGLDRAVRISEITETRSRRFQGDGVVEFDNERVTVHNDGSERVDLSGWTLDCGGRGQTFVFPAGTTMPAGGEVHVWTAPVNDARPGVDFSLGWKKRHVWARDGDIGRLRGARGQLVDEVRYGDEA